MFFVPQFEKKVGELLGDLFQPFVLYLLDLNYSAAIP
jgi:hypothetical protein